MSGHTPGPWMVEPDEREKYGLVGYNVEAEGEAIVGCEGILAGGRGEANARLIAAAPDLLEALKPLAKAAEAYRNAYGNFVASGETMTERRFSEGEREDTALEVVGQYLACLPRDAWEAAEAAIAKATEASQ